MKNFGAAANPALVSALGLFLMASATIIGAWIFQAFGYAPCELCLKERLPYYVGIGLAAVTIAIAARGPRGLLPVAFLLLFLTFAGSAGLGTYHAGVEWHLWPGPTECTGGYQKAPSMVEFLRQLHQARVVRCDTPAIRILGLSLAGWNAVISIGLAALAGLGFWLSIASLRRPAPKTPS